MLLEKTRRNSSLSLIMRIGSTPKSINAKRLAPFLALFVLAGIDTAWAALIHIRFIGCELTIYVSAILLAISFFYSSFRKEKRLSEISYYAALWILFTAVLAPFTYVFATLNLG